MCCPKEAFGKRFSIPFNLTNFIYYFYGLFNSLKQQQQKVTVLDLKKYLKNLKSPFLKHPFAMAALLFDIWKF